MALASFTVLLWSALLQSALLQSALLWSALLQSALLQSALLQSALLQFALLQSALQSALLRDKKLSPRVFCRFCVCHQPMYTLQDRVQFTLHEHLHVIAPKPLRRTIVHRPLASRVVCLVGCILKLGAEAACVPDVCLPFESVFKYSDCLTRRNPMLQVCNSIFQCSYFAI